MNISNFPQVNSRENLYKEGFKIRSWCTECCAWHVFYVWKGIKTLPIFTWIWTDLVRQRLLFWSILSVFLLIKLGLFCQNCLWESWINDLLEAGGEHFSRLRSVRICLPMMLMHMTSWELPEQSPWPKNIFCGGAWLPYFFNSAICTLIFLSSPSFLWNMQCIRCIFQMHIWSKRNVFVSYIIAYTNLNSKKKPKKSQREIPPVPPGFHANWCFSL